MLGALFSIIQDELQEAIEEERQNFVMNNLSYLKNENWLIERDKKWNSLLSRWIDGTSEKEVSARKEYFFKGDIDLYIENADRPSLYCVISESPFQDVGLVIESITKYWFWVLEEPNSRDRFEQIPDINSRFHFHFHAIFSCKGGSIHPSVCIGLFDWLYGSTYEYNRSVFLSHSGKSVLIPISIDIDNLCHELTNGIIEYLWYQNVGQNITIFKSFISYFLSIYPHMSPRCFETKLPIRDKFEVGSVTFFRKYWIWNRWLLTTLNGFISEYEEDEEIEELVCNDDEALSQLKNGLNNLKMPEEFFRLQEFVLEHKGNSLYASE